MKDDFVIESFIEAMRDVGRYGQQKYGDDSFQSRLRLGDCSRGIAVRTISTSIADHSCAHFRMYLEGERHDHFRTLKHQLTAVAFNAMMEYQFAALEFEDCPFHRWCGLKDRKQCSLCGLEEMINADNS